MTTIVTRAGKGSALTNTEMDTNLTNLNNDKIELSNLASPPAIGSSTPAAGTFTNLTASGTVSFSSALPVGQGGTASTTASGARTNLGLVIGTNVQAYDADIPTVSASQVEMETGTETALRSMSPLRVSQAIAALSDAVPVGTILDFAGTSAPSGFLVCPISATDISRTTYASLFSVIGTTWGVGDGSTTFGMPFFPSDYSSIQANANVGTSSTGTIKAHTHSYTAKGGSATGGYATTVGGGNSTSLTTGSTGGSTNLAAGTR